jgi:hypothetical protein
VKTQGSERWVLIHGQLGESHAQLDTISMGPGILSWTMFFEGPKAQDNNTFF